VKPTVVKLGGSVITVKDEEFTPNLPAINRLAKEIADAHLDSMILIHGGGSFGHPVAREYQIVEGYKTPGQRIGFSKTRQAMMTLNKLVIDAFVRQSLPVVTVQPSACITTKGGRIQHFDVTAIQHLLRLGFIPVLYGDATLDLEVGFTILSGDQITAELATIFNAEKTVIAVDVDGLFTDDPKSNPKAKLINEVSPEELNGLLNSIDEAKTVDVTKGMRGKITELLPAVERGIQIDLVNASIAGRLYKALKGEKVTGTKITRVRLR
jgi:isopentenyl phosphate kinase